MRVLLPPLLCVSLGVLLGVAAAQQVSPETPEVPTAAPRLELVVVAGSINPASADHIIQGIERAEREG
ncbi:MAG: nodulation protein NfeD, partial [Myxococcota bacterium]